MKKLIICVALSAFACSLLAGESGSSKQKPACADKPATCCAAKAAACAAKSGACKADKPACCKKAKFQRAKKALQSPKAASLAE